MSLPSPPAKDADVALMQAVAAGDAGAQKALVQRLAGRVWRLARLFSGSSADADDAAQVALLEVLGSAHGFRYATSLEAWADRITARTTLRIARRERRRWSDLGRWFGAGSSPWGRSSDGALASEIGLEPLLDRLSDDRRQAFILRHAIGYSVEEIAELTGTTVGTVKDRLVHARKKLRHLLDLEARRAERGGVA